MLLIRKERIENIPFIHKLNEESFGQSAEADLVDALRNAGALTCSLVAVLDDQIVGHPEYYPKFGFIPAKPHGIAWEHDVPKDVFMVLELKKGALDTINGTVRFHEAFDTV